MDKTVFDWKIGIYYNRVSLYPAVSRSEIMLKGECILSLISGINYLRCILIVSLVDRGLKACPAVSLRVAISCEIIGMVSRYPV